MRVSTAQCVIWMVSEERHLSVLEMMRVVVAAAQHGEVRHLEGVGGAAAALQCARHCVAHVEVSLRHVRRQIQLLTMNKR